MGVAVALALLVPPLVFLRGHATERDYVPMLAITERVCDALEPDDAVVLVGGTRTATGLPQLVSTFCSVPVAVVDNETTTQDLARISRSAAEAGKRLVYLSPSPDPALGEAPVPGEFEPVVDLPVTVVALSLTGRPDELFTFPMPLYRATAP